MVKEYSLIDDSSLYPSIKKIRYPKAGESNPELRIGIIRIKGYGRKWIDMAKTQNDYLPWMEWVNSEKIAFLKMDRKQQNWDMFVSDRVSGKSLKILSESDENGWLESEIQIICNAFNLDETNDRDAILYMIAEQRLNETR